MEHKEQKKLTWKDLWEAAQVVFGYVGEKRNDAIALTFLSLLSALLGAAVPFLVGKFIDSLIAFASGGGVSAWIWLMPLSAWFAIVFFSNLVDWRLGIRARRVGSYIHTLSSARWFNKLLLLPMYFHKQEKSGEVNNKISRASGYLSQLIESILLGVGPQILSMLIGVGFSYFIQPELALVVLVGMFVYGFMSIKTALPLAQHQKAGNKAWSEAYGNVFDALGSVQAVKQAVAEHFIQSQTNRDFIVKAFEAWMKPEMIWATIRVLQRTSVIVTQLAVFLGSVYFVSRGDMTVGGLVALNGYTAMVFGPLAQLAMNWNTVQNGLTTIHDVGEIMDVTEEAYERPDGQIPKEWIGSISFHDVQFAYPDAPERSVLNNVSFDIKDGQTIAFVGESGVGKSTSVELIGGYYYPTKGEVMVSGVLTTNVPLRALREHIAVVPQEPVLFNDTVINNIRFGKPDATDSEVYEAAKKAYAHEFISTFPEKYQQLVGEKGVKLSVGQKQRIAIARAVLRNPKILILDEPTSALDARTESQITESLEELMRGRTTIIIAHRLSTVRKADNIIVFEAGEVVEQGSHAELVEKEGGVYRKLYEYQIGLQA